MPSVRYTHTKRRRNLDLIFDCLIKLLKKELYNNVTSLSINYFNKLTYIDLDYNTKSKFFEQIYKNIFYLKLTPI